MARAHNEEQQYFTFVAGLHTEAGPLTYPENTSIDEDNFNLRVDGSRRRRKGYKVAESLRTLSSAGGKGALWQSSSRTFKWKTAGGGSSTPLLVVQVGGVLYFYKEATGDLEASSIGSVALEPYRQSSINNVRRNPCSFAQASNGVLIVAQKYIDPIRIKYNPSNDSLDVRVISPGERDFDGIDDDLGVSQRPSSLSSAHEYNLRNQGWPLDKINEFEAALSVYPSNADIWFYGKGMRRQDLSGSTVDDQVFLPGLLEIQDFGQTEAPKGRFLRSIFDTGAVFLGTGNINITSSWSYSDANREATITTSTAHNIPVNQSVAITNNEFRYQQDLGDPGEPIIVEGTGSLDGTHTVKSVPDSTTLVIDFNLGNNFEGFVNKNVSTGNIEGAAYDHPNPKVTDRRPSQTAFFAGRVWFGGIDDANWRDRIYFSQIVKDDKNYSKCYQASDPTSEHLNELLPTDGGFVTVPELGLLKCMIPQGNSLLLCSDTGVWEIGPGDRGFFAADSYYVRQVSSIAVVSPFWTKAQGAPIVVGIDGFYMVQEDERSGRISLQSLTDETLRTLIEQIPLYIKEQIKPIYDEIGKKTYFFYKDEESYAIDGIPFAPGSTFYNRVLVLDWRLGAFYKYRVDTLLDAPFRDLGTVNWAGLTDIALIDKSPDDVERIRIFACTHSGEEVQRLFNGTLSDEDFYDWDDKDAEAFLETAYDFVDAARFIQAPVIFCYLERTEDGFEEDGQDLKATHPSSCLMQARWNWADHEVSGKFGPEQQVYRYRRPYWPSGASDDYNTGEPVIVTRNKVRGRGRAVHLRFSTEPEKDCRLLGWAVQYQVKPEV